MDSYLMHLRMQNDIKCLKRKNLWNNIWINSITLTLIIIMIACVFSVEITSSSALYPAFILLIFIIYIYARYFPEMKIGYKGIKEACKYYFNKKSK
ncbi:hypothetical protein PFNF54_00594 [Plasmodium falciparum NF54]|nr:hypothetical protein PFNF54_00594 [Plasmodium falciparum NF54]